MAGDYDPSNKAHVSALADALGVGPLTWSARGDPANRYMMLLVCRRGDGAEYTMQTLAGIQRDVDRFVSGVSAALLAGVVAGVP